MSEETLFDLARKTPEAERAALLERVCQGKPELRARVEVLLKADVASSPLSKQSPTLDLTAGFNHTAQASPDLVGSIIDGRFKLQQKLGEGGMGTVWVAEQEQPVKRRVALKLIKAGMDSAQVIRRFEAERQALALMDHTNIAKVLDAGTAANGRPYFVMELVKGVPITKYCDEVHASIKNRLELFVQVCSAVQHAHQKGIIHRDIKPSNVLIAMQDGKPVPKVIDFGVAKALHSKLADKTMYTEIGQIIGTLEYMAPEQAELSAMDIDTRADIYALGVLLYELLTGSTPITRERMKSAAFAEVIRLIKEEDPPKPSTRLTQSKESLANLAALRKTDPKHLSAELKGELDWVVLKALEKDRTCRYETANGFARDIQRYLSNEVVEARPSSAGYRLRKLVARNRGKVIAASFIALSLLAGVIGTIISLMEARKQRDIAELARQSESVERQRADQQAAVVQAVNEFLTKDILGANPYTGLNTGTEGGPSVLEAIQKAAKVVGQRFSDRPLIEASVRRSIGVAMLEYNRLDPAAEQLDLAIGLFKKALGEQDTSESILATLNLAWVRLKQGRLLESERLHLEAVRRGEKALPEDHDLRQVAIDHTAYCLSLLKKYDSAEQLFKQSIEERLRTTGETHGLQMVRNNLAMMYYRQGRFDAAEQLYRQALEELTRLLGGEHPNTVLILDNLAALLLVQSRFTDAEPLLKQALAGERKAFGSERTNMLLPILLKLQVTYASLSRWAEASDVLRQKIDLLNNKDQPSSRARDLALLGLYQGYERKYSDAESNFRECLAIREKTQPDAWTTFNTKSMLGGALLRQKKYADAEPLLLKGYEGMNAREKTIPPQGSTRLAEALDRLIQLYTETNKPDEVKKWQSVKDKLTKPVEKK
jgi:serine/threonine protein kinase/tetratricopeptide (TPR) repeat protein